MKVRIDPHLLVSRVRWAGPIHDGTECMTADTDLGRLALYRCQSRVPSAGSAVGGVLEDWKILLDGGELAEMWGVAPPGYAMRAQVARGVRGKVASDPVSVLGVTSLFDGKRFVRFSTPEAHIVEFCGRWGNVVARDGQGELLAQKKSLAWEAPEHDMRVFGAIALVEMARLEYVLRNPFLAAF